MKTDFIEVKLRNIIINASDSSAEDWKNEITSFLEGWLAGYSDKQANSPLTQAWIEGEKDMLNEVIGFLKKN